MMTRPAFDVCRRAAIIAILASAGGAAGQACIWTQKIPGESLPPRYQSAMAYDPVRARVVLFGGNSGSANLGDTWEWDGASWQLKATTGPKARAGHVMAYHGGMGKIVLFGGSMTAPIEGRTWFWDGVQWVASPEDNGQFSPARGAMVYDAANDKLILMGGDDSVSPFTTHDLDPGGTGWWRVVSIPSPPRYVGCAAAYDSDRAKIVLYGGQPAAVWEFDGAGAGSWTQVGQGPPARSGAAMAYDAPRHRMVVAGGTASSFAPPLGDVWEQEGSGWVRRADDGPERRREGCMVFDAARSALLYGTGRFGQTVMGDIWRFNGANTQSIFVTLEPPSELLAPLGYPFSIQAAAQGVINGYQWYRNDVVLEDGGGLSGTHTPTLSFSSAAAGDGGNYRLRILGNCGTASVATRMQTFDPNCPANCDHSTALPFLNANDFQCFMNIFAAGASGANCDQSTTPPVLNANDFQCFLGHFAAGC